MQEPRELDKRYGLHLILLVSFILFSRSIFFGFVFDDFNHIVNNRYLEGFSKDFLDIFKSSVWPGNLYRPVFYLIIATIYRIFGKDPIYFHLVSLFFHLFNVTLLFCVFKALFNHRIAILSSFLFAIHPIHVEVICCVSYLPELLATFFTLLAFNSIIYLKKNLFKYLAFFLCSFFAFLSKESSITYLILSFFVPFFSTRDFKFNRFLKEISPLVLIFLISFVIYSFLRIAVLGSFFSSVIKSGGTTRFVDNYLVELDFYQRLIPSTLILGKYFLNSFWPMNLRADYSYSELNFSQFNRPENYLYLISFVLFFIAFLRSLFGRKYANSFALGWFLCSLCLFINLIFPIGTIFADRLAYFASISICLFLALIFDRNYSSKLVKTFYIILILSFFIKSFYYSSRWESSHVLYETEVLSETKSAKMLNNLATLVLEEGRVEIARGYYLRSHQTDEGYIDPIKGLIEISYRQKNYNDLFKWARIALKINPRDVPILNYLGRVYYENKRYADAKEAYSFAYSINPKSYLARIGLLKTYLQLDSIVESKKYYDSLVKESALPNTVSEELSEITKEHSILFLE